MKQSCGGSNSVTQPVAVTTLRGRRDLRRFVDVPFRIYRDDPMWRPPLRLERRMHLSPRFNPAFEHLDWQAWLAWRDGTPIGRISAQIDRLHLERYADDTGFIGMLEAPDDAETFAALTDAAQAWLRERGMTRVRGPLNLTINEECGLLVEGFETPPMLMMGHARPYYAAQLEALGYRKAKDMLAYRVNTDFEHPAPMMRLLKRYAERIRLRAIDGKAFARELDGIRDIFNEAWRNNWGFVPFTPAEFRDLGKSLRLLLPDDFVQIAEVDGEAAAFIVGLPNLNEVIRDLGGRLGPVALAKVWWRLKWRFPETGRVALMGVRQQYQHSPLGAALAYSAIAALQTQVLRRGGRVWEMSWILEDNKGMRDIIESLGSDAYKRYRVYQKPL